MLQFKLGIRLRNLRLEHSPPIFFILPIVIKEDLFTFSSVHFFLNIALASTNIFYTSIIVKEDLVTSSSVQFFLATNSFCRAI